MTVVHEVEAPSGKSDRRPNAGPESFGDAERYSDEIFEGLRVARTDFGHGQ